MTKFTKTALASGVVALALAGGFALTNSSADAQGRGGEYADGGKRMAHYGGGRGSYGGHRWGGRHGGRGRHRGRRMKRARAMMERYDANNDGRLTTDEVRTGRQAQIDRYDRDNNGSISIEEFAPLWAEIQRQRIVRRFQRLDRDGDGQVTSEEFVDRAVRMVERMDRNGDGALSREDRRGRGYGRGGRGEGRGFWRRNRGDDAPERGGETAPETDAPQQQ